MSDFDYDASDVAACLRKLTIEKYSETLIDIDDSEPPYLFVSYIAKNLDNYIKYFDEALQWVEENGAKSDEMAQRIKENNVQ